MNKKFMNIKNLMLIIVGLFSFFVNFYYGNIGVSPMDTFAFFDTGYNILNGKHPFRDIWVTTGPLVDYTQALFFKIFGLNWQSYLIHGSIFNLIISVSFFLVLIKFNLNKYISFIYAISFSILCYTVSGTPFAYIHSYVLSLFSILILFLGIKTKSNLAFIFLPLTMLLSFFSMQTPSVYINIIILLILILFFFKNKNLKLFYFFCLGSFISIILFLSFFYFLKIPFIDIYQQYFLFPISIGEYRISGNELSHISLSDRLTFRNVLGHFKFINIFILLIIFFTFLNIYKGNKKNILDEDILINLSLVALGLALIFNQLITSNQTYIFSLISFIGAFLHIYINKRFTHFKKIKILIIFLIIFSTFKYHNVFNEKRKFMDLQLVQLETSVNANKLDKKFKNLKWVTPAFAKNPQKEIKLLEEALEHLRENNKNKMVLTYYQFFSLLLEEDLNIPNRWYTNDNNSYPLKNHKYFNYYKKHFNDNLKNNKIEVVYSIGHPKLENFLQYTDNVCFDKSTINEITTVYNLRKCN